MLPKLPLEDKNKFSKKAESEMPKNKLTNILWRRWKMTAVSQGQWAFRILCLSGAFYPTSNRCPAINRHSNRCWDIKCFREYCSRDMLGFQKATSTTCSINQPVSHFMKLLKKATTLWIMKWVVTVVQEKGKCVKKSEEQDTNVNLSVIFLLKKKGWDASFRDSKSTEYLSK